MEPRDTLLYRPVNKVNMYTPSSLLILSECHQSRVLYCLCCVSQAGDLYVAFTDRAVHEGAILLQHVAFTAASG